MTQELKTMKNDENNDLKRLKKTAEDTLPDSLKRNEHKSKTEDQDNKITRYFNLKQINLPRRTENSAPTSDREENKVDQLEERIKQKQKQIQDLKEKRQQEEEKANNIVFQTRQLKHKTKPLLAKNALAVAEAKRKERRQRNDKMGYFNEGMRTYTEGEYLTSIKKTISELEERIKKLQEQTKSKTKNEQYVRNLSSLEFTQRELIEQKKELVHRQKQVAVYKDRVKLSQKQIKSYYCKLDWPVVYQRYQTLELLGSGGFGEVYKCYDLENNRIIALKRVYLSSIADQEERADFFKHVLREAEIQKKLSHPNIAKFQSIVEINRENNLLVFELEYCSGPQLGTYLRKNGCLEEKEAKVYMKQLFSALDYLSKLKDRVIHYDLKPSNIMFDQGTVKILDFGLSKIMHDEDTRMDLTSQGVGTYWYLPPETFEDFNPKISAKVDVWSLGVIFFELLYGRKPFGHGISQHQVYNRGLILRAFKVQFPSETPRKFRVSDSAKQFISSCLKYDQEQRLSASQAYNHLYFSK